jgi:hypothetical protein
LAAHDFCARGPRARLAWSHHPNIPATEVSMRTTISLTAFLFSTMLLGGCSKPGESNQGATDTLRHAADTTVTERSVKDTTIVTHDTVIHSDTVRKMGGAPRGGARRGAASRRP